MQAWDRTSRSETKGVKAARFKSIRNIWIFCNVRANTGEIKSQEFRGNRKRIEIALLPCY